MPDALARFTDKDAAVIEGRLRSLAVALGVRFIVGKLKGDDLFTIQAVEFDKENWSIGSARQWLRSQEFFFADKFEDKDGAFVFPVRDRGDFDPESFKEMTTSQVARKHADGDPVLHEIPGVEVFRTGTWNGDKYTARDLDDMVEAFGQLGFKPAVKLGHDDKSGAPAFGWVKSLRRAGEKLIADFMDVPDEIFKAIKGRRFDNVSSEIFFNFRRNGKVFRRALKAVALLGAEPPAVDLAPLRSVVFDAAEFGECRIYQVNLRKEAKSMATKDIAKLDAPALKAYRDELKADMAKLGDDDAEKRAEFTTAIAAVNERIADLAEAAAADATKKLTDAEKARTNSDADAVEIRKMQDRLADAERRLAQAEADKRTETIKNKVQALPLPALRQHFEAIYELAFAGSEAKKTVKFTVDDKTGDVDPIRVIDDLVARLDKYTQGLLREHAVHGDLKRSDQTADDDPGAELNRLAQAYQAKHAGTDYAKAFAAVLADPENAELKRRYAAA